MPDFQRIQHQFAAAIRDPAHSPQLGVVPERLAVYQDLFFNNVLNFVSSAFPVLSTLYSPAQWQQKVRLFFQHSSLPSPYFLDIAASFLHWLQQQPLQAEDRPFLVELAHYEWIELYLATAHRQLDFVKLQQIDHQQPLALDELALVLSYHYPVSQISAAYTPEQSLAQPSLLLVYRDPADEIKFVALNQLSASLLQLLASTPGLSLSELCVALQKLAPQFTEDTILEGARPLLLDLAKKGVIRAFQAG